MQSRLPGWLALLGLMLAAVVAGGWLGVSSVKGLYTLYRSQTWISTPCKVTRSEIGQTTGRVANGGWYVSAICAYAAGGGLHTVNCSPHLTGSRDLAAGQFNSLRVNSEHVCYVNPRDPAEAVFVENQGLLPPLIFLCVALIFIGLGGTGTVFLIRNIPS